MKATTGIIAICAALLVAAPAFAGSKIAYIPDPVYQSFDPEMGSPMQEMIHLAENGDVRAQFILGDLYAKGKGGLKKSERRGAKWFETAAKNGYYPGLVRLAAIAKRKKKPVDAYKWYTLAVKLMPRRDPWALHAETAREALVKDFDMKADQMDEGKKEANVWADEARQWRKEQEALKKAEAKETAVAKQAAAEKVEEKEEKKEDKKAGKKEDRPATAETKEKPIARQQEYNR